MNTNTNVNIDPPLLSPQEIKTKVVDIHNNILKQSQEIGISKSQVFLTSSALITKLIQCIADITDSIDLLFTLPIKSQEEYSYLIINSCKLIYELGNPLIWLKCGNYLTNRFIYASLALESIIHLNTANHMRLRFKLFVSAIYSSISCEHFSQAISILHYATIQVKELRVRESIDLPIPSKILTVIVECEMDIAVLQATLHFFTNPDGFDLNSLDSIEFYKVPIFMDKESYDNMILSESKENLSSKGFVERVISECCRILFMNSSNRNEEWIKRSSMIVNTFIKNFQTDNIFTIDCLFDIASLLVFEDLVLEAGNKSMILESIFQRANELQSSLLSSSLSYNQDFQPWNSIQLIQCIWKLIEYPNTPSSLNPKHLGRDDFEMLSMLMNRLMLVDSTTLIHKGFMSKVAMTIWSKYIYGILQHSLSSSKLNQGEEKKEKDMREEEQEQQRMTMIGLLEPYLQLVSKSLEYVFCNDSILTSSLVCLTGLIMKQSGDYRGAISIFQRSIQYIEDHRAILVDLDRFNHSDNRDLISLQKSSITLHRDYIDWYQSLSRPGNQPLSGIGIFGAGSSFDRQSQALSEIHTELFVLYFRTELEYALLQRTKRNVYSSHHNHSHSHNSHGKNGTNNINESNSGVGTIKGNITTTLMSKDDSALTKSKTYTNKDSKVAVKNNPNSLKSNIILQNYSATSITTAIVDSIKSIEDLDNTLKSLKAYCCKNNYMRAILYMEMARIEVNYYPEKAFDYLQSAASFIEEAERNEQILCNTMKVDMSEERRYPIVFSRSHKTIYVSPFISSNDKMIYGDDLYYRIIAKEYGSGTTISIYNTSSMSDYIGCDRKVFLNDTLQYFPIPISGFRSGEKYVFGSIAYQKSTDKMIESTLSLTSPFVEALNPLPIVALWSLLATTTAEIFMNHPIPITISLSSKNMATDMVNPVELIRKATKKVIDKFIISNSSHSTDESSLNKKGNNNIVKFCIGRGINIAIGSDSRMDTLAIEQSSDYILQLVVINYLLFIDTIVIPSLPINHEALSNWKESISVYEMILSYTQTLSVISILAVYIESQDLCLKCVIRGYNLLSILYRYDEMNVLPYTQSILLNMIVCMQSLNKSYWNELEYDIYCKLLAHMIRSAVLSNNFSSMILLLNSFHDVREKEKMTTLSESTRMKYLSIYTIIYQVGNGILKPYLSEYNQSIADVFQSNQNKLSSAANIGNSNNNINNADMTVTKSRKNSVTGKDSKTSNSNNNSTVVDDSNEILSFWSMNNSNRIYLIKLSMSSIISNMFSNTITEKSQTIPVELQPIEKGLKELPEKMSDMLAIVSILLKGLRQYNQSNNNINSNINSSNDGNSNTNTTVNKVLKLLKLLSIYDKFLATTIQDFILEYDLSYIKVINLPTVSDSSIIDITTESNKVKKLEKDSKNTTKEKDKEKTKEKKSKTIETKNNSDLPTTIPERYIICDRVEVTLQMKYIGEITSLIASICYSKAYIPNSCPKSNNGGPYQSIDVTTINNQSITQSKADAIVSKLVQSVDTITNTTKNDSSSNNNSIIPTVQSLSTTKQITEFPVDGLLSKQSYIRYLFASLDMFQNSKNISSAIVICTRIWNFIIDEWFSPIEFIEFLSSSIPNESVSKDSETTLSGDMKDRIVSDSKGYILKVTKALTNLIIQTSQMITKQSNLNHSSLPTDDSLMPLEMENHVEQKIEFYSRTLKQYLLSLRDLSWYMITCLFLCNNYYEEVVEYGMSILESYVNISLSDGIPNLYNQCKDYSDRVLPLLSYSQSKILITSNRIALNQCNRILSEYISTYESEQLKKRKKKPRITRLEKDEEEIQFEEHRDKLMTYVTQMETSLKESENKYDMLSTMEKSYSNYYSMGYTLYDKVKVMASEFISNCKSYMLQSSHNSLLTNNIVYEDCIESSPILFDAYSKLNEQFKKLIDYLRERKLKSILLRSIDLYGNILLLFLPSNPINNRRTIDSYGNTSTRMIYLRRIWHEAIDSVFSVLDVHNMENWMNICSDLDQKFEIAITSSNNSISYSDKMGKNRTDGSSRWNNVAGTEVKNTYLEEILFCIPTLLSILGKLIRYTASSDYDHKNSYATIAANLCYYMFRYDSLSHPIVLHKYACYTISQSVGGYLSYHIRKDFMNSYSFSIAMNDIIDTLLYHNKHLDLLPIYVFMEYYHKTQTNNVSYWLDIRLQRIHSLISLRYYSEAFVMFSDIPSTLLAIYNRTEWNSIALRDGKGIFNSVVENSGDSDNNNNNSNNLVNYDLNESGYYIKGTDITGYSNHLLPDSTENVKAIEWILSFPKLFQSYAESLTRSKNMSELTDHDKSHLGLWNIPYFTENNTTVSSATVTVTTSATSTTSAEKKPNSSNGNTKSKISSPRGKESNSPSSIVSIPVLHPTHVDRISILCAEFIQSIVSVVDMTPSDNMEKIQNNNLFYNKISLETYGIITSILSNLKCTDDTFTIISQLSSKSSSSQNGNDRILSEDMNTVQYFIDRIKILEYMKVFTYTQKCNLAYLIRSSKFREARSACHRTLQLITALENVVKIKMIFDYKTKEILSNLWLDMKYTLIVIAKYQARYEEAIVLCNQLCNTEIISMLYGYWMKRVLLIRCEIYILCDKINDAVKDCDYIMKCYENNKNKNQTKLTKSTLIDGSPLNSNSISSSTVKNNKNSSRNREDMLYYNALLLQAKLLQIKSNSMSREEVILSNFKILDVMLQAKEVAMTCAYHKGFLGYNNRMTLMTSSTSSNTTAMESTENSNVDTEKNNKVKNNGADKNSKGKSIIDDNNSNNNNDNSHKILSSREKERNNLWNAIITNGNVIPWQSQFLPIDDLKNMDKISENNLVNMVNYCNSNFTNNYLEEVEAIVRIHSNLCIVIDEILSSNYFDANLSYIPKTASLPIQPISKIKNSTTVSKTQKRNRMELISASMDIEIDETQAIIKEDLSTLQYHLSIDGLKCLRYVFYTNPLIRAKLILAYGKIRLIPSLASSKLNGEYIVEPFYIAYNLIKDSNHSYDILRQLCIQLMEVYGNNTVVWNIALENITSKSEHGMVPLMITVKMMQMALKLSTITSLFHIIAKRNTIVATLERKNSLERMTEMLGLTIDEQGSLKNNVSDELSSMIKAYYPTLSINTIVSDTMTVETASPRKSKNSNIKTTKDTKDNKDSLTSPLNDSLNVGPKGSSPRKTSIHSPKKITNTSNTVKGIDNNISYLEAIEILASLVYESGYSQFSSTDYNQPDRSIPSITVTSMISNIHSLLKKYSVVYRSKFCIEDDLPMMSQNLSTSSYTSIPASSSISSSNNVTVGSSKNNMMTTVTTKSLNITVASGSISMLWSQVPSPHGFTSSSLARMMDLTSSTSPSTTITGTSTGTSYQHLAVYFLLGTAIPITPQPAIISKDTKSKGSKVNTNSTKDNSNNTSGNNKSMISPTKGKSQSTTQTLVPEETSDPILTKLLLYRPDLLFVRSKIQMILRSFDDKNEKDGTTLLIELKESRVEEFSYVLILLAELLSVGYIDVNFDSKNPNKKYKDMTIKDIVNGIVKPHVIVSVTSLNSEINVNVNTTIATAISVGNEIDAVKVTILNNNSMISKDKGISESKSEVTTGQIESDGNRIECIVPCTDKIVKNLDRILSFEQDIDNLIENSLCILLRSLLGYGMK